MNATSRPPELEGGQLILGRRDLVTPHGLFEVTFFRDQPRGRTAMTLAMGDLRRRETLLARVHSSCVTSECLLACDCDCSEQLDRSLAAIGGVGRGVVFYLMQEGRGAGLTAKARDRMMVQASRHRLTTFDAYAEMGLPADLRRYDAIGPMARALAIRGPLELMTNNPDKVDGVARALANEKIEVARTRSIQGPTSAFNQDYLRAKRRSGHTLLREATRLGALPPEPLEIEGVRQAEDHPHLLSTARYFLPVAFPGESGSSAPWAGVETVEWFSMRVIHDRRSARESVLLSLGSSSEDPTRNDHELTMTLIDRLPGEAARGRGALREILCAMRRAGVGRVAVKFDETNPEADRQDPIAPAPDLNGEVLAARWGEGASQRDEWSDTWLGVDDGER